MPKLPPTLEKLSISLAFAGLIAIMVASIYVLFTGPHRSVQVPCDIAEISPDIPTHLKEQCRKARAARTTS